MDVIELELASAGITCGDLAIPENVTLEEELDKVCVSVVAPKAEVEEEVEEEEEGEAAEGAEEGAEATPEGAPKTEEPAASTEE